MLPGTELAFAGNVKYQSQCLWPKVIESRVGKFSVLDPQLPQRHHDAVEFPDGSRVLVTQLVPGQRVPVLQLPVTSRNSKPATQERGAVGIPENPPLPAYPPLPA
jgi:hypothetical protein